MCFGAWGLGDEQVLPFSNSGSRLTGSAPEQKSSLWLDSLHSVSALVVLSELVSRWKDIPRAAHFKLALLGAGWFVCILPCSFISASVLNLAPQVLHLYFFPNSPIFWLSPSFGAIVK